MIDKYLFASMLCAVGLTVNIKYVMLWIMATQYYWQSFLLANFLTDYYLAQIAVQSQIDSRILYQSVSYVFNNCKQPFSNKGAKRWKTDRTVIIGYHNL